jgi:hypothetical protein
MRAETPVGVNVKRMLYLSNVNDSLDVLAVFHEISHEWPRAEGRNDRL